MTAARPAVSVSASGRLSPPGQIALQIAANQALSGPPGVFFRPQDGTAIPLTLTALSSSNFTGTVALGDIPGGSVELTAQSTQGQPLSSIDVFTLLPVVPTQDAEVYSRDGRLEMRLPTGAVPTDSLCVVYTSRSPTMVPSGWTARRVGPVLSISLGDTTRLHRGEAVLDLRYREGDLAGLDRSSLRLYRWQTDAPGWQAVPTLSVPTAKMLSATVPELGVFALFAEPARDVTPPAAITNLTVTTGPGSWTIALRWTAPGDDGLTGTAAGYVAKFSPSPITADNWAECASLPLRRVPGPAGTAESCTNQMPDPGADYYFAVRAQDETGNLGPLSNLARAQSNRVDTDGDGLPDIWELTHGLSPNDPSDAAADTDGDGLTNLQEFTLGTKPGSGDTDGDGLSDGWESVHGLDPTSSSDATQDADADGLTNADEYQHSTDPREGDTDDDGLPDAWEVRHRLCPFSVFGDDGAKGDPDQDGQTNLEEYLAGTDPVVTVRPEFGPCEVLADGRFRLTVRGQAGRRYEVQVSTDLVAWTLWTDFVSSNTFTVLHDTSFPTASARFYRLMQR